VTAGFVAVPLALAVAVFAAADVVASPPASAPGTAPPEIIGRVRAVRLPCALVRDLVGPAVSASMDVDAAFTTARAQLGDYALAGRHRDAANAAQTMAMQRLDRTIAQMARGVGTIRRALGDPRIAPQHDADVQALRDALEKLYAAEDQKLNAVSGYVEGERMGQLRADDESMWQMRSANAWPAINPPDPPRALETPEPFATNHPRMLSPNARQNPLAVPSPQPWIILDEDAAGAPRADDPRLHIAQLESEASRQIVIVATGCH
jgi:hypothetical protein